jgi:kynurenine formamidase
MPTPTALIDLAEGLASGSVRLVDLTQPLSERTPVLVLPEPFANTPGLSRVPLSRYDDAGPAWAWDVLTLGEHVGTHFDAPIHWITGRDGEDVASVPLERLVGPAAVIDKSAEAGVDPGFLLTLEDVRAWEAEHGALPEGGWLFLRTGWDARAHDQDEFLNVVDGQPRPRAPTPSARAGWPRRRRSWASAWRPWAPTRARRAGSTRPSRSITSCSGRASTGSRRSPTWPSSRRPARSSWWRR